MNEQWKELQKEWIKKYKKNCPLCAYEHVNLDVLGSYIFKECTILWCHVQCDTKFARDENVPVTEDEESNVVSVNRKNDLSDWF